MGQKESMTLQMEPDLREQASDLFEALGMDLDTATGIFYRQALRCHGLPFAVCLNDEPNAVTLAAFEEGERLLNDPNAKRFSSVDELFEDLVAG